MMPEVGLEALAAKYNPVLVMYPQDFERPRPRRSWWGLGNVPRGDYHPCSAEFFLSQVVQRERPLPWITGFLSGLARIPVLGRLVRQLAKFVTMDPSHEPLGLARLRELVGTAGPDGTRGWEIDVGPIRSQQRDLAWPAYYRMVLGHPESFRAVVYGRAVPYHDSDRMALQYWYLYVYNDAGNYHEGDWENVAIELDQDGHPLRAGYSSHKGGYQRPWGEVETRGERPIVYVARGSHASYFGYRKNGHRTHSFAAPKGLPSALEWIVNRWHEFWVTVFFLLKLHDFTSTRPDASGSPPWKRGCIVDPELRILPRIEDVDIDSTSWWMMIRCRWGSQHSRIRGTVAPNPPWEQHPKWDDPLGWLDGLKRQRNLDRDRALSG